MAHGNPPVVGQRVVLNRFLSFQERLSQEIQNDQLEGLKSLLQDQIPAGILEQCCTARRLFNRMKQQGLLGEDNLGFLEQLLAEVGRADLVERIRDFQSQSSMDVDCDSPAGEMVHFSFAVQRKDFNIEATKTTLLASMCAALHANPEELCFVQCQEVAVNWFDLTFEIPNRKELLDVLRCDAIKKAPWLSVCAVKAVRIGKEAQIIMQPLTRSLSASVEADSDTQDTPCCHNDKKLDVIVVVDCAMSNPVVMRHLKMQLKYMVDAIFRKDLHFRMALVSYQNHQLPPRVRTGHPYINSTAFLQTFTDDKEEMKNYIQSLRCFGKKGPRRGLADGLALAVHLSKGVDGDISKCRKEAVKVCILLPFEDQRGTLDIFKCTHGHDVTNLCTQLAANSVTLYTVMLKTLQPVSAHLQNPAHQLMAEFFSGISLMTGGQFIYTCNFKLISQIIVYTIEEDISMERLFGTAHDIVIEKLNKSENGDVDLEELRQILEDALNQRFCRVNLITFNGSTAGPSSKPAKKFSLDDGIESACKTFRCELERMRQCMANTPETPQDVDMEETASLQVSLSTDHEITNEASDRMLQRVVRRRERYWPR